MRKPEAAHCTAALMSAREGENARQRAMAQRAQSIAASGRRELTWKLFVENKLKPPVQFYETKRHPTYREALKRALAIYRHPGWRLRVLYIEASNGERIEAADIDEWCERAPPDDQ